MSFPLNFKDASTLSSELYLLSVRWFPHQCTNRQSHYDSHLMLYTLLMYITIRNYFQVKLHYTSIFKYILWFEGISFLGQILSDCILRAMEGMNFFGNKIVSRMKMSLKYFL